MSTLAPTIGGASSSNHSAWNPYAILPATTKRRIDPKLANTTTIPFLTALKIPANVAAERLNGKYLQLDPPKGKESDWRKLETTKQASEKEKKRLKRLKEGECGLIGRRKRQKLAKEDDKIIAYDAVLPIHHLWLGYMSEITGLALVIPSNAPEIHNSALITTTTTTTTLLPMFPSRNPQTSQDLTSPTAAELKVNVINLHAKLVKAEFIGCILCVKRAKNPSLVALKGIVLQETQSTFKIVTIASEIKVLPKKNSIFTFSLPLVIPPSTNTPVLIPGSNITTLQREISFDIFGDAFLFRSSDRVNKKFKVGAGSGGVQLG